jgi:hypothetical protein
MADIRDDMPRADGPQNAVFVAAIGIFQLRLPVETMHTRQARINRVALVSRVADRVTHAVAHDLGLDEQGVLELGLRRVAFVARIVRVHEHERSGLQLTKHAAGRFADHAAGPGAGDQLDRDAVGLDQLAREHDVLHHHADHIAPFLRAADVLGLAVIGLQPREPQGRVLADLVHQVHRRAARRHAAAAVAHVDLHKNVDHRCRTPVGRPRVVHRLRQPADALRAVHGNRELAALGGRAIGQRRNARQLGRGDHFVADIDVVDAAGHHRLRLGGLLHAHAHSARLHLQPGQRRALVHLGVGAPAHVVLFGKVRHARQVAVHRVQVDDE